MALEFSILLTITDSENTFVMILYRHINGNQSISLSLCKMSRSKLLTAYLKDLDKLDKFTTKNNK